MSEYLYHYTSMESIFGMLQSYSKDNPYCTMWASNVLFMNDASEYQFGQNVCRDLVLQYEGEIQPQQGFSYIYYKNEAWREEELNYPYIISFSERVDSAAIWNMYSNNGTGIVIIFDIEKLQETPRISLGACWYCNDADNLLFDNHIRARISDTYNSCVDMDYGDAPLDIDATTFYDTMKAFMFLMKIAPKIKHASFDYEAEWRLTKSGIDKPKFRCKNGVIIPYKEVHIPIDAIKGFVIGPTANFEYIQKSLRLYLTSRGLDGLAKNITKSTVPYRG